MLLILEEQAGQITAHDATPFERLLARMHHSRLDCDLAAGTSPDANTLLALRAQILVCPGGAPPATQHHRGDHRGSYRSLCAARPDAGAGTSGWRCDAADLLQALVDRIRTPDPLPARGVAQVQRLLTDGSGPLYYPGTEERLRSNVQDALEALEPLSGW